MLPYDGFQRHVVFHLLLALMISMPPVSGAEDAVLDGLVNKALEENPGVQAVMHRAAAARQVHWQARSAYLPRLSASAMYTVTDNPPQSFMMMLNQQRLDMADPAFDLNTPDDTGNIRFSIGAKYRLYDGARGPRTAAAGRGVQLAALRYQAACNLLIHEVTRGYYQVLQAQAFVAIQTAALTSLEESLRVARARFDSGSAVMTDVLNLEVQTAQARENVIRARNGVQMAIAALNTSVGCLVVDTDGLTLPDPVAPDTEKPFVETERIQDRPEFGIAEAQVDIARQMLDATRLDRGLSLNAFGHVDWDSERLRDQEQSYLAGVLFEWEWFSGFEQAGKKGEAEQMLHAAARRREQIFNELALEVKQAGLDVEEAWARLQVTSRAVGSAEEALRITRAQYTEGAVEIAMLLVADLGLTETRMRDTTALYDYRIACSNLDRATGALVQRYPSAPVTANGD